MTLAEWHVVQKRYAETSDSHRVADLANSALRTGTSGDPHFQNLQNVPPPGGDKCTMEVFTFKTCTTPTGREKSADPPKSDTADGALPALTDLWSGPKLDTFSTVSGTLAAGAGSGLSTATTGG